MTKAEAIKRAKASSEHSYKLGLRETYYVYKKGNGYNYCRKDRIGTVDRFNIVASVTDGVVSRY